MPRKSWACIGAAGLLLSARSCSAGWSTFVSGCDARAIAAEPPVGAQHPSAGCTKMRKHPRGIHTNFMEVFEPAWPGGWASRTPREFTVDMPTGLPSLQKPAPLLLWFHGQFNRAHGEARWNTDGYRECARANNYITVYPQGFDDFINSTWTINGEPSNSGRADMGTGWNVGVAGDESLCLRASQLKRGGPLPDVVQSEYSCYKSCVDRNKCGKCNFSTCHDDVLFTKALLKRIAEEYCVDLSRIYAAGGSAGGMFAHYLSQQMPDTFAAFSTIYSLPFAQYAQGKNAELVRHADELRQSSILAFHGLNDTTIPHIGGLSMDAGWQWYYRSLDELMTIWAAIHGCDADAAEVEMPVSIPSVVLYVRCYEYANCNSGKRVMKCLYHGDDGVGKHGTVPKAGVAGSTAIWFMNQLRRTTVPAWLPKHHHVHLSHYVEVPALDSVEAPQ